MNNNKIIFLTIPKVCPYCGKPIKIKKDNESKILYCPNEQCESRLINHLDHFFGKKGLNIKGLSKATFEKLIDWGWVNSITDIFNLNNYKEEWIKKSGFGEKSVSKTLKAIEEGKNTTLEAFISAIGISLIGQAAAKDLAKEFKTYENFKKAVLDDLYSFDILDNFGYEMNESIKNYDYKEADIIANLLNFEIIKDSKVSSNTLEKKIIVITGKLNNFKNRNELKKVIEEHGGKVSSSISSKTNILINNDINSTSSKNKQAKEYGISIISESDFITQYLEK